MPETPAIGAAAAARADDRYRIARWKAELAAARVESRFRQHVERHSSRYLQVVLLPDTPGDKAVAVAERLCRRLEGAEVIVGGHRFRVTTTVGVTVMTPEDRTINDLVLRADAALYEGKNGGRDQVRAA